MNVFQGIKKINFNLNENYIIEYVLILLNFEWLFPYVFSIKFDMNCNKLYKNISNEYKKKIFDLNKKRKNILMIVIIHILVIIIIIIIIKMIIILILLKIIKIFLI